LDLAAGIDCRGGEEVEEEEEEEVVVVVFSMVGLF
jgi:hypothetical protein